MGYEIATASTTSGHCSAHAMIAQEEVTHYFAQGLRPQNSIDVGRNEDEELVWVTNTVAHYPVSLPEPQRIPDYEKPDEDYLHKPSGKLEAFAPFLARLRSKRKSLLWGLGVLVIVLAVATSTIAQDEQVKEVPIIASQEIKKPTDTLSPEDAAIEFVRRGEVPRFNVDDSQELLAHVVSQSGELVLVEVSADTNEDTKEFATLLLHKQETTWRIRQVFDAEA